MHFKRHFAIQNASRKKYVRLHCLKFSDPLPKTHLFCIWPYHPTGAEGELDVLLSFFFFFFFFLLFVCALFSGMVTRVFCFCFSCALVSVFCASSSLCYGMICGCGIPWLYSLDFL